MTDQLKRAVDALDRRRAHRSRLEPDRVVLPPRHAGDAARRFCGTCWTPASDNEARRDWQYDVESSCGCLAREYTPTYRGWRHWDTEHRGYIEHEWEGLTACPKCGGELHTVTP